MKKISKLLCSLMAMTLLVTCFVGCAKKMTVEDIAGTYEHTYEEEFDGDKVVMTDVIILNSDKTCDIQFQDSIKGTWDVDGYIVTPIDLDGNVAKNKFSVKDGILTYDQDGTKIEFKKVS